MEGCAALGCHCWGILGGGNEDGVGAAHPGGPGWAEGYHEASPEKADKTVSIANNIYTSDLFWIVEFVCLLPVEKEIFK